VSFREWLREVVDEATDALVLGLMFLMLGVLIVLVVTICACASLFPVVLMASVLWYIAKVAGVVP
jgi:hypothetical protein